MPFGEYELSPSLIGLSLLHTTHPEAFQRLLVRTSIRCYPDFILDKGRSLGFASACNNSFRPVKTRFRFGCGTSKPLTLLIPATRRFIMQKARRHSLIEAPTACRRMVSGTLSLLYTRCFSPFPHGTGSLSVSYEYLALADGPAGFTQDFSCPALLRILLCFISLRIRGFHPLWRNFPDTSSHHTSCNNAVLQPHQDRNPDGLGSSPFARHY